MLTRPSPLAECKNGWCTPPAGSQPDGTHCSTSTVCKSGNCQHSKCTPKGPEHAYCYKVR